MDKLFFWNWHLGADKTVARFDRGEMSNQEKFRHFLVIAILVSILTAFSLELDYSEDYLISSGLFMLVDLASLVLGAIYLYRKHTEPTSFIEKYFVVIIATIPVVIICLVLPYFFLSGWGYHLLFGIEAEVNLWYELATTIVLNILIYLKLGTYFK